MHCILITMISLKTLVGDLMKMFPLIRRVLE